MDRGKAEDDAVERESSRPDFAVLAPQRLTQITKETPATFLVVASDDNLSPNSIDYWTALRKAGVPAELHVYRRAGHGFGMTGRTPEFTKLPVAGWPARFQEWMIDMAFLPR